MKYTFVNKNKLIPQILYFDNEKLAINELIETTNICNNSFLKNIYIVCETNLDYYLIINNGNNIVKLINDKIEIINKQYLKSNTILDNLEKIFTDNKNIELVIKNKNIKNKNIIINNNNIENKENEENEENVENVENVENEENVENVENEELKKSCNEVFQLYNKELAKIKKIENSIKNLEKKEEKIINKIKNDNIDKINKLYYDYNTFIKIKIKKSDSNSDKFTIPELFKKKYDYFYELLLNSNYSEILEKLKNLNINDPDSYLPNSEIILFSKKYLLDSKNLNCSFDHDWDDLTSDTEGIIKAKGLSSRTNS